MFKFVIVEDMEEFRNKIINVIDSFSIKYKVEVEVEIFNDYTNNLKKLIKTDKSFKIYILDIELPNKENINGIQIANFIRKYDNKSLIIFITDYFTKYSMDILQSKIMFLKFISKKSNYAEELPTLFKEQMLNKYRKNILIIQTKTMLYRFECNDLLYVITNERKVKFILSYMEFESSKQLKQVREMVDNRFMPSHKSCIVNIERISKIDTKNKIIYFDNGKFTDIVSKNYLRSIIVAIKD